MLQEKVGKLDGRLRKVKKYGNEEILNATGKGKCFEEVQRELEIYFKKTVKEGSNGKKRTE